MCSREWLSETDQPTCLCCSGSEPRQVALIGRVMPVVRGGGRPLGVVASIFLRPCTLAKPALLQFLSDESHTKRHGRSGFVTSKVSALQRSVSGEVAASSGSASLFVVG